MGVERPAERIPLEPSKQPFRRGSIVMARTSAPDSAASQFFIVTKISKDLAERWQREQRYTIIGEILNRGPQPSKIGDLAPAAGPAGPTNKDMLDKLEKGDKIARIVIREKSPRYHDKE